MSMKIVFLDAGTLYGPPSLRDLFLPFGEVQLYESTRPNEVVERIADAEIVLTNKVVLDDNILAQSPALRLICVTATGTNNIDLVAAQKYGIRVKNAAHYSTHSVAQTTLAMALHLLMKFPSRQDFVQQSYSHHPFFTHLEPDFREINGKTWGIIGLGAIGKKVANLAEAFGAKVIYHSPSGQVQEVAYEHATLPILMGTSDIISIHSPLNRLTQNLITSKELKACKTTTILINVARGGIVDEQALADALDNDLLGGAGVDVFSVEPILSSNPLLHLKKKEKLLLSPHIAWGSREAREKLMGIVIENIRSYCAH
jgi:glycerate dehydrogenase